MTDDQILSVIQQDQADELVKYIQDNVAKIDRLQDKINYWFCYSCQIGSIQIVKSLHEKGFVPDLNSIQALGRTPLACAIIKDQKEVISYLMEQRIDWNVKVTVDGFTYSYLTLAMLSSNFQLAEYLMDKKGFLPEEIDLILATDGNQLNLIKKILDKGVSVNAINHYPIKGGEYSALYVACLLNHIESAKLLLENGADPNLGIEEESPIFPAITQNNLPLVSLLMEYGANVTDKVTIHRKNIT